ncbi:hypothetical protein TNCV_795011 [Trichonephila clavipes]|nr:hypothetical protein TNCV_795011 [Trichonephila clavipes]
MNETPANKLAGRQSDPETSWRRSERFPLIGLERKLEFSGTNAEGVYTQCEEKRKTMKEEFLKINNPSEGRGNEREACDEHRTSWATKRPRNKLASKRYE